MKHIVVSIISIFISLLIYSQNCNQLQVSFDSYESAISIIRKSSFKIAETINTSSSSWITSAEYYSCDGKIGYFIYLTARGKKYIHKGVPLQLWYEFKKSNSFGEYYNDNIRDKYLFRQ